MQNFFERQTMPNAINAQQIQQIAQDYQTPCWAYDAAMIRAQIAQLRQFDVIRFAQKILQQHPYPQLNGGKQGVLVDFSFVRRSRTRLGGRL